MDNPLKFSSVLQVAALVPKSELEGEMGDAHMALQARLMSQALRKLSHSLSLSQTILIFINQVGLIKVCAFWVRLAPMLLWNCYWLYKPEMFLLAVLFPSFYVVWEVVQMLSRIMNKLRPL